MAKDKPRPANPVINTNIGADRAQRLRALAARLTKERGGTVTLTKLVEEGIDLILSRHGG